MRDALYIVMETPIDRIEEELPRLEVGVFSSLDKAIAFCEDKMEPLLDEGEKIVSNNHPGVKPYITMRFPDDSIPSYIIYPRYVDVED